MNTLPLKATDLIIRPITLPGYRLLMVCTVFILSLASAPAQGQAETPQEGSSAVTDAPTLAQTKAPPAGSSVAESAPALGQESSPGVKPAPQGQTATPQENPLQANQGPTRKLQGQAGALTAPSRVSQVPAAASTQAPVSTATLPRDLDPWGMFLASDWVIKVVIIGLILASIATWTLYLAKSLELRAGKRHLRETLERLWEARTRTEGIRALRKGEGTASWFADTIERELDLTAHHAEKEGIKERLGLQLGRIEVAASQRITRGTGLLATIGSTAPFVGLFGTVWGIMNSFIGISKAQTTNLAVVAPGIAEALLVTAVGLLTAIPAVIIYNLLARVTAGYRALLADTASEALQLISRDLERAPDLARNPPKRLHQLGE